MKSHLPRAAAFVALLLLAACGGGGGGGGGGGSSGGGGGVAPTISAQPSSVTVVDGAVASFKVTAAGTAPLTYQWTRSDANIKGATAATYTITATYPADNGASFKVIVTNGTGNATSVAAKLTVTPIAPTITKHPGDVTVGEGASADFIAAANGSAPLAYQWQSEQAGSTSYVDIIGATGSTYRLKVAQQSNSGSKFRVVVSNDGGSAISNAANLRVNPAAPSIRTQPHDLTVQRGKSATFSVEAYGTPPLHFQWYRNAVALANTDSASYTLATTVSGDDGAQFSVDVTNNVPPYKVTSATATLHVVVGEIAPTSVRLSPAGSFTVGEGAPVNFVATVDSGATAVNYEWSKNGKVLAGEVGDHLDIAQATAPMDGDTYSVRVYNGAGAFTSAVSTLHVTPGKFTLLGGHVGGVGNVDGSGATAQFNSPAGVAMDSAGNAYVADSNNYTIRKITSSGVVTTIAGQPGTRGKKDGAGTSTATFNVPRGVAVDDSGNIYVADQGNNAIRRIDVNGDVLTIAGSGAAGSMDSLTGTLATFNRPVAVAVIGAALYVVDAGNNKIRQVDIGPSGTFAVTTVSGSPTNAAGSDNGPLLAATYSNPTGISADAVNTVLYVSDSGNALVRKLDLAGAVTTLAGVLHSTVGNDGDLAHATFKSTDGLVYSAAAQAVFVSDATSHTIRKIDLSVLNTGVTTFAGSSTNPGVGGGVGAAARFNGPQGIAITQAGDRIVVADNTSNLIDQITVSTRLVAELAGSSVARGYANGKAADSLFNVPTGLAVDSAQKLYVADSANQVIRVIDLTKPQSDPGYVSLYAGGFGQAGTGNGPLLSARFNNPKALALGGGALYVAEVGNDSVRKIDLSSGTVSKVPDSGALLKDPSGVAVDSTGNLYVASTLNHNIYLMSGGTVTLIAGNGAPGLANGNGAAAQFSSPVGVALDEANHLLYVADRDNCAIRTIDVSTSAYMVSTLAGGLSVVGCGFSDGGPAKAKFAGPVQIAVDGTATAGQPGNVYVTDVANHSVRKVTSAGVVSTVVGSPALIGIQLGSSDPNANGLNAPYGVIVDAANGRLYLSDIAEHAVMRISPLP